MYSHSTKNRFQSPSRGWLKGVDMMTVRFRALVAAAMLLVAAQSLSAQTPAPTDLGNLGGGSAQTNAVAQGYVAGASTIAGGDTHAFVWSAATGMVNIGASLPSPYSGATSVNSHGEVVGGYYAADFSSATAFYWSQATGIVIIGPTTNWNQSPVFIGESGVVAGTTDQGNVFRWTPTGGLQDLGGNGSGPYYTDVAGVNARGDIIGNFRNDGTAFVAWASASGLTILHSPGTTSPPTNVGYTENAGQVDIHVNAINDSGVVVGTYWDFYYGYYGYYVPWGGFFSAWVHNSHAFKWTSAGEFTDLGNLGTTTYPGNPNPIFASSANAINNSGTIVGSSNLPTGGYAPFVYDPATGHLTQLPALYNGDNAASAKGINDDGVVVGYANGLAAAVMWNNGVLTNLVPNFQWPYWPLIKGSTIAGNGLDGNWNGHAWVLSLPTVTPSDTTPPVIVPQVSGTLGNNGWYVSNVTVSWTVTDAESDVSSTSGCTTSTVTSDTGGTTFTCTATSAGGTASNSVTIRRDATAPVVSCSVTPNTVWPPNHKMVNVNASVSVSDATSSAAGFTLAAVLSNEPDNGLGDGDTPNDIQGFVLGTADTAGQVRAERSGKGNGRVYTLTYTGVDQAGNSASCSATVSVPHNR